ncbi:FG-GAP-like repeat-containing protein [Promineifilum sp.]|uniref:FG-GAP-like repeat-containing protein n=1 Tax=Promineifilum sp. TaxID=2664178 RepID=UPI0035B37782
MKHVANGRLCLIVGIFLFSLWVLGNYWNNQNSEHRAQAAPAASAPVQFMPAIQTRATPVSPLRDWQHLSSAQGDLPVPGPSVEQSAALVGDLNGDGLNDFIIASRLPPGPSVQWYERLAGGGWAYHVIESDALPIEAGGALHDIDGDGDLDLALGANGRDNAIWWWENPYPAPAERWQRRPIKNNGQPRHHDMLFGQFDDDPAVEFVYWNQSASRLFAVDVPDNPRTARPWPGARPIHVAGSGRYEGLAKGDVNVDGRLDIVAGGRWLEYQGGNTYKPHLIADMEQTRIAVGDVKPGGWLEVVISPGDADGPARWYEWDGVAWVGADLFEHPVKQAHSLELGDVNGDNLLDIFIAEMAFAPEAERHNPNAQAWLLYGDGEGGFTTQSVSSGFGNHESRLADLDGDGDLDILSKPFSWQTPRVDVWLNQGGQPDLGCGPLTNWTWQTHLVDDARPRRAVFIDTADLDGDTDPDIVAGAWWYRNPGVAGGAWERREIGAPLNQMAVVGDFDADGDADILGTVHNGPQEQHGNAFVWARNDGAGEFTMLDNIDAGSGDFLQGAVLGEFGGARRVMLSWHDHTGGIESLTIPADPSAERWTLAQASPVTLGEELSAGDIDGDGDTDLLLGVGWLENTAAGWSAHTLFKTDAAPDRNRLADVNGDGRLDAIVGYEAINRPGVVAWYEAPEDRTQPWTEHVIATVIGPHSLDVGDLDGDGDADVVVGEHNLTNPEEGRVLIFENAGGSWQQHLVATGHEHHDGAQLADVDGDGDGDIVSIGWGHDDVLLYEALACSPSDVPSPTQGGDPYP